MNTKNKDNEVFKTNWKSYIKLDLVKRKKAQFPLLDFVEVFNDDLIVKGSDTTSLVTIQGGKEFIDLMGPEVSSSPEPEPIAEEGGASNDKEKENEQTTDTIDPGTGNNEENTSNKEASGSTTVIQPKRKKKKVDNQRHKVLELKPPIAERILDPVNTIGGQNNVQGQEPLASRLATKITGKFFFLDCY